MSILLRFLGISYRECLDYFLVLQLLNLVPKPLFGNALYLNGFHSQRGLWEREIWVEFLDRYSQETFISNNN